MDINTIIYLENEMDQSPGGGSIIIINDTYSLYEDETVTVSVGTYSKTAIIDNGTATIKGFTETGTITVSVSDFTKTISISSYSKYEVGVGSDPYGDFDYTSWLLSIGESTSGYSSLDDVLADEKMVRELFTRHGSVDYLVSVSTSSAVTTIINNDYCAKWINLRDYALDTLYADSNIASLMDSADKYFYGEWAIVDSTTTPPTWGAKGNVPMMTSNTAPYGTASAYQVFDGNPSTTANGTDFSYQATNPICVRGFICKNTSNEDIPGGTLQGSNDGGTWTSISTPSENTSYYLYHRVHFEISHTVATVQFYGRDLRVSVPKMTSNTAPYGEVSANSVYGERSAYKAFDNNNTTYWESNGKVASVSDPIYLMYSNDRMNRITIKKIRIFMGTSMWGNDFRNTFQFKIQGYNELNAWVDLTDVLSVSSSGVIRNANGDIFVDIDVDTIQHFSKYRLVILSNQQANQYGSYNVCHIIQFYGLDYSEYDWDTDNPRHYIYDHGVELETLVESKGSNSNPTITKTPSTIELKSGSGNPSWAAMGTQIDVTNYSLARLCAGTIFYLGDAGDATDHGTTIQAWTNTSFTNNLANTFCTLYDLPYNNNLDVSNINQSCYLCICEPSGSAITTSFTELWLE